MGFGFRTRNNHNMYDMASMLQKSIRRCDVEKAGYAAMELFGNYNKYLWKRLLVISAEDCYGIMSKEIISLKLTDDEVNAGKKGYDRDPLFVAKAIVLLCLARKNRDGCYMACNFMLPDRVLNDDEIEHVDITKCQLGDDGIPDWVFDVHTIRGKANGKTDLDMTISEQEALTPIQMSLFDNCSWEPYYNNEREHGRMGDKEWAKFQQFKEGKKPVPDGLIMDDE